MRLRLMPILFCVLTSALCFGATVSARAVQYTITLSATRTILLANGKQATQLTAQVRDGSGRPVNGGLEVQFNTTAGTLTQARVEVFSGVARTQLTSSPVVGVAHVTASISSAFSPPLDIVFTDDPDATFVGNNYMLVTGSSYLAYSATDRVIEAQGKSGGAHVTFRNLDLSADRVQIRCDDSVVRASTNIVLKRGKETVKAIRLFYSLTSGQGYAIAENKDGHYNQVVISGENLVQSPPSGVIPTSYFNFPEMQIKLVVVARSITYFPNDRLQFRRARFFQDQTQILSLPYYEMQLNTQELFSDHFISVGTNGLGLELPFYYNLSPRTSGILTLRHQQSLGRGYYAYQPGWAIDLVQGYSSQGDHRYEGAYGFTGLTRGDWGFQWNHSQEFNSATQGNFTVDFPQHQGVYTSTSMSAQTKLFRFGGDASIGQTFTNPATTLNSDFYAETNPHRFGVSHDFFYTFGTKFTSGRTDSRDVLSNFSQTTEEMTTRLFTRPVPLDARTTLNNSFTLGHVWSDTGSNGFVGLATVSLDRTLPGGGTVNLTYDLVSRPAGLLDQTGTHRVSLNYTLASAKRLQVSLFGSTFLDTSDSTLVADAVYRLDNQWRLMFSATLQAFQGESYKDLELTIGRRVGARELQLTYSTFYRRLSVDLTATRF